MARERPPIEDILHVGKLRLAATAAAIEEIERAGAIQVVAAVEWAVHMSTSEQELIGALYRICAQYPIESSS